MTDQEKQSFFEELVWDRLAKKIKFTSTVEKVEPFEVSNEAQHIANFSDLKISFKNAGSNTESTD